MIKQIDKDALIEKIANGKAQLLGIEDICSRIGVSRTTFDRWVRNGGYDKNISGTKTLQEIAIGSILGKNDPFLNNVFSSDSIKFPPPDIRIGNSPKWEMETFKTWLRTNTGS